VRAQVQSIQYGLSPNANLERPDISYWSSSRSDLALGAERFQQYKMLLDCEQNATQVMTPQTLSFCDGADDRPQPRIMSVRNIWEQMMFDLVVETTREPSGEARAGGEVGCSTDLVHSPIVSFANPSKFHARRKMRNLKDDRQHPAEDDMKENECGARSHQRQDEEGRQD